MILLPAIDLMDGQVVRLKQGRAAEKTVYATDPVAVARQWEAQGGDYLHLVDLDAAFTGVPRNLDIVRQIVAAVNLPCELGGGMRDLQTIERALDTGVARVVIGTRAAESLGFIEEAAATFGAQRIAVGIDAKNGVVAVKGWTESSGLDALRLAVDAQNAGAGTIIYTDIATDGMLEGPNFAAIRSLLGVLQCRLIASGGVSRFADLEKLAAFPTLHGVIIGRALYEKTVDLAAATAWFRARR